MTAKLSVNDVRVQDQEPRVSHYRLAEALEAGQQVVCRLIERNAAELSTFGEILATAAKNNDPRGRGRPGTEYMLNEQQALLVCMFARTERAAQVRRQVIEVFVAWRHGEVPTPPHRQKFGAGPDLWPLAEMQARVAMVRETRQSFGTAAARRMWHTLGLPHVHETGCKGGEHSEGEGYESLRQILDAQIEGTPVRTLLRRALDGEAQAARKLAEHGVRVLDGEGVLFANSHPFLTAAVRRGPPHRLTLKCITGAVPHRVAKFGRLSMRGTLVPLAAVDDEMVEDA